MGYLHIENLKSDHPILLMRSCYAMEKIHGTSAHVGWNGQSVEFFAGGCKHETFVKIFNEQELSAKFSEKGINFTLYGEAYGGNMQGMKSTYGPDLRFVVFDVNIGGHWLDVERAEKFVESLGFEFVSYRVIPNDIEHLNQERDADSVQAVRNGMGSGHKREGIVIRPLVEMTLNNGARLIAKYKGECYQERKPKNELKERDNTANMVAEEWVTHNRLNNILSHIPEYSLQDTGKIIALMIEDVTREGEGEVEMTPDVKRAIGRNTALLFKQFLSCK